MNKTNIKLTQSINENYDKLVFLNEEYETTFNNYNKRNNSIVNGKLGINPWFIVHTTRLPIDTLDKIKVDIYIKYSFSRIELEIQARTIYRNSNSLTYNALAIVHYPTQKLELGDFVIAFVEIGKIIQYYKFNNVVGVFSDTRITKAKEMRSVFNKMFNTPNITLSVKECCVCLDVTQITTPCNHTVCYKCWEQITPIYKKKCPMCRGELDENDSEDDDGEEDD